MSLVLVVRIRMASILFVLIWNGSVLILLSHTYIPKPFIMYIFAKACCQWAMWSSVLSQFHQNGENENGSLCICQNAGKVPSHFRYVLADKTPGPLVRSFHQRFMSFWNCLEKGLWSMLVSHLFYFLLRDLSSAREKDFLLESFVDAFSHAFCYQILICEAQNVTTRSLCFCSNLQQSLSSNAKETFGKY
jgi:hypothetical protein